MLSVTLLFASMFALYKLIPTLALSVVLLVPFPVIGVVLLSKRMHDRWRLIACAALPAVFAFYLGLIGSLTAFVPMPKEWGMVPARSAITATVNNASPITLGGPVTALLTEYQVG